MREKTKKYPKSCQCHQGLYLYLTDVGIAFDNVMAIVSDSAAYCKKAYRAVLSAVFPKSTHVLCLAHIVNLAAEVFHHYSDFKHTSDLISMTSFPFFKKQARRVVILYS